MVNLHHNLPQTVGELKKIGYSFKSIKEEIRDNLITRIKSQEEIFPGIYGYEKTVEKQVINAILSKHNFILLGLRGQGKTRIIRSLVHFLDDWCPVLEGTLLNENPLAPISPLGKKILAELGNQAPIKWLSKEERFNEKLATPDVSIADLLGDIDPIKAAREKLDISNEEIIHWGIIPRSNRGIFSINELPDLQPRIQVGLFNILEEQDIQIRGFPLRLPLDILLVFSANPEDYTNRGRIITPLKDRIESQIITHYPKDIETAKKITLAETDPKLLKEIEFDEILLDIVENIAIEARKSEFSDSMSGVSQRLSIAALENILSNCRRRQLVEEGGEKKKIVSKVRVIDIYASITAITGKVELIEERSSEEIEQIAGVMVNKAVTSVLSSILPPIYESKKYSSFIDTKEDEEDMNFSLPEYQSLINYFKEGNKVVLAEEINDADILRTLEEIPGLKSLANKYFPKHKQSFIMETILEFFHGQSLISRKVEDGIVTFIDIYGTMFRNI